MKPSFKGQCHHCGETMLIQGETLEEMKAIRRASEGDIISWNCPNCKELTEFAIEEIKEGS